jgi:hypothetical protein
MIATPGATPLTTPVEPAVAMDKLLLAHAPPAVVSINVVVEPAHTLIVPVMLSGNGFTVTTVVVKPVPVV